MNESYDVGCTCGKFVSAKIYEAGTKKKCPFCSQWISVPDSITLKESSGDLYPYLSPLEKIEQTFLNSQPPFNGLCHGCEEHQAKYMIPCCVNIMQERAVKHDGQVRPTVTGHIEFVVAESFESWKKTRFALFLCEICYKDYQLDISKEKLFSYLKQAILVLCLLLFLLFTYHYAEIVALFVGFFSLLWVLAIFLRYKNSKNISFSNKKWFSKIRWFSEVIENEDEFVFQVMQTQSITE